MCDAVRIPVTVKWAICCQALKGSINVFVCVNDQNIRCIFLVNSFVYQFYHFGAPQTSWVTSTQHRERYIPTGEFFLSQTKIVNLGMNSLTLYYYHLHLDLCYLYSIS